MWMCFESLDVLMIVILTFVIMRMVVILSSILFLPTFCGTRTPHNHILIFEIWGKHQILRFQQTSYNIHQIL